MKFDLFPRDEGILAFFRESCRLGFTKRSLDDFWVIRKVVGFHDRATPEYSWVIILQVVNWRYFRGYMSFRGRSVPVAHD